MRKINTHVLFIAALFVLSLFFLNNILHKDRILGNVHYINDLTFLSYNVKESLKNNELPLWTPYFYAGHPLLAIPENYMFDLNFLFVYLFGDIYLAMNAGVVFYLFLAGLGMYLLMHSIVDDRRAAFISANAYMFNGFLHSFILHGHMNILEGYAMLPFVFLFVNKALKSAEWIFYSILAGIFLALQILAGSIILFFYTGLIVFFYMAFNLVSKNFRKALIKTMFAGIIILAVTLSISSVKLLPVLEFTKMSSRAVNVSFTEFLGEPVKFKDIIRIAVTNAGYSGLSAATGLVGFMLIIYGLSRYKRKMVLFSLFLILFSVLFASGTFLADMMYKVPGFDRQRHVERAIVIFAFAASILAAYGFIALSERLKKHPIYSKYKNYAFALIVFLILAEMLFLQAFPTSTKVIQPEDIKLLEYAGNDNSLFRVMNIALRDIIGASGYNYYAQKGISDVKGGGGIWINDYVGFLGFAQQSLSPKILGMLNVRYIVSDKVLESENITLVDKFNECKECDLQEAFGPYLYKNQHFLPRYYLVPNSVLVVGDNRLVKQAIYSLMLKNWEPEKTVLVEGTKINDYDAEFLKKFSFILLLSNSVDENSIQKLRQYKEHGGVLVPDILEGRKDVSNEDIKALFNITTGDYKEIKINKYSNNMVVIGLNGQNGWLVASERFAHFPGWKASVNAKNIDIFKANEVITAMYLDGEAGKLVFEYKPDSYRKGRLISLAALIIILFYFGYFVFNKKFKRGGQNQI